MLVTLKGFGGIWERRVTKALSPAPKPVWSSRFLQHDWRGGRRQGSLPLAHRRQNSV